MRPQPPTPASPTLTLHSAPPTDSLGYNNVGFHNPQQISPEIDRLAQTEGVVLEAMYTFRYCSPSRSALMTGRFPLHVNQGNPPCVVSLRIPACQLLRLMAACERRERSAASICA